MVSKFSIIISHCLIRYNDFFSAIKYTDLTRENIIGFLNTIETSVTKHSMTKVFFDRLKSYPILQSSLAIGGIIFLAKLLGYFEKVILAYYFGTSYEVDVYYVIIAIILSVFIFFREIIEPGFLNVFMKALNAKDEQGAWDLFNKYCRYILVVTILLCIGAYAFPEKVIDLFAPGFTTERKELAITLIQISFPACVFLSLSALTNITLNGLKSFALPASGELAFKAVILLSLFLLYQHWGIYATIFGVVVGAGAKLLVHCFLLYKYFSIKKVTLNPEYAKETWKLTWPLLIGVAFSQVSSLVDNIFASYLQEGAISALSYSKKIIELPILVFPYILSVVIFPYFSELAIAKNKEKLSQLLSQSLAWITLIFLPLSVFFFSFSNELVEIIFKRGAFDEYSAILTSQPLSIYSIGMVFFAIETILVIFYFANGNTKTPIFIGIICVILNIILTYAFVKTIGYEGIALALVISKSVKVLVLLYLLKNSLIINYRNVNPFFFKTSISCVTLAVIIYLSKYQFQEIFYSSLLGKILFLILIFVVGAFAYGASLFLMRFEGKFLLNKLAMK